MRALAPEYEDKNVLVVGGNGSDCRRVAEYYGFKNVVTPEEVHAVYPAVCPSSANEVRSVPLPEVWRMASTIMMPFEREREKKEEETDIDLLTLLSTGTV